MYMEHHHIIVYVSPYAAHAKVETCFVVVGEQEHPISVQVSKTFEGVEWGVHYQNYSVSDLFPTGSSLQGICEGGAHETNC